jgi:excinuclease UvrABC ATPase subunit
MPTQSFSTISNSTESLEIIMTQVKLQCAQQNVRNITYQFPLYPDTSYNYSRTSTKSTEIRETLLAQIIHDKALPTFCWNVKIPSKMAFTLHNVIHNLANILQSPLKNIPAVNSCTLTVQCVKNHFHRKQWH